METRCPMCLGHPVNDPQARIKSQPCYLCGGLGTLDTDKICTCGRPAVKEAEGKWICVNFECLAALLKEKEKST